MVHLSGQKKIKSTEKDKFFFIIPLRVQFYSLYKSVNDLCNQIRYINLPGFQKFVGLKFSANNFFWSSAF